MRSSGSQPPRSVVSACGSDPDAGAADATSDESVSSAAPPEDASVSSENVSDSDAPQGLQQNGPITVEGDPLVPFESPLDDPSVGTAAPVVTGESFDGTPVTIGGPTENPTLVVFLAHWCPHCNDEIPELLALDDAGDLPEGLDVVGVSTAVDPTGANYPPSDWAVDKDWPWRMMADDEELSAIVAYGGTSFPFTVVLDAEGNVLARRAGAASAAETLAFLDAALAG